MDKGRQGKCPYYSVSVPILGDTSFLVGHGTATPPDSRSQEPPHEAAAHMLGGKIWRVGTHKILEYRQASVV